MSATKATQSPAERTTPNDILFPNLHSSSKFSDSPFGNLKHSYSHVDDGIDEHEQR